MDLSPDHLLIAAPDLESGSDFAEALLGTRPVTGGSHPGMGSRNALLGLENDVYIEVIAPDPAQSPDLPLASFLASIPEPALTWWCARSVDLVELKRQLGTLGIESGPVDSWSRQRPDGTSLRWQLLMPGDTALGPLLPFFIQWEDMGQHPSRHLPVIGRLESLVITHPDAVDVAGLFREEVMIGSDGETGFEVTLEIGGRRVSLPSGGVPAPAFGVIAGY